MSLGDASLGAAVDDDACALGGERGGDGEADSGGGAGDEGEFVGELQVHMGGGESPFLNLLLFLFRSVEAEKQSKNKKKKIEESYNVGSPREPE